MAKKFVVFKVYRTANKMKSIRGYGPGFTSISLTKKDILEAIRDLGYDFCFIDAQQTKDVTCSQLLYLLKSTENCTDVQFLNRIIREGGFIEYIRKLENQSL